MNLSFYKDSYRKLLNLNNLNLFFVICISCLLFFHVILSRGLDEDGVFRMAEILLFNKFPYSEVSRLFFHRIYHFPFYLITHFTDIKSLPFLTAFYSFSIVSIHILSLIACYFILPKDKKEFIFFPFFAFLVGPAVSLGISISIALSVCSYVWFIAFLIHYSNLNKGSHKLLFVLAPLPLILSHELMIYISLLFIFLLILKYKKEKSLINKAIIKIVIIFFIIISILQSALINTSSNYNLFQESFFNFKFLINDGLNINVLLSLLLSASFYFLFLKAHFNNKKQIKYFNRAQAFLLYIILAILFVLIGAMFFNLQNYFLPESDYHARVYIPTISLTLILFAWFFLKDQDIKGLYNNTPSAFYFIYSCVLYCSLLIFSRFYSDWQFYNYQRDFTGRVESCAGIVSLSEFKNLSPNEKYNSLIIDKIQIWKVQASSLIYPRSNSIKSIIRFSKKEFVEFCSTFQRKNFKQCDLIYEVHDLFSKNNMEKFTSQNKFFNFEPLLKNIKNNISHCN